ncbi:MAG TPA: ABC transporter substrate-binding protein [Baekduia sp.]
MSTIKIGVHANNPALFLLSHLDLAQRALAPLGVEVEWHRYTGGTETGRKLVDGVIDVGGTGATPPIVDQANGLPVVYLAHSDPRPAHGTLLVAPGSDVASVADLRGRRVALGIGSWQTLLLAVALDRAGVAFDEVEAVESGPDSLEQLQAGELGAWIGQGPQHVRAVESGAAVELVPASDLIANPSLWYTRRDVAERRGAELGAIAGALEDAGLWAAAHPGAAAELFAEHEGGAPEAWEAFVRRIPWTVNPIGAAFVAEQQAGADVLARVGFLPRPVTIAEATVAELASYVEAGLEAAREARGTEAAAPVR